MKNNRGLSLGEDISLNNGMCGLGIWAGEGRLRAQMRSLRGPAVRGMEIILQGKIPLSIVTEPSEEGRRHRNAALSPRR